MAVRTAVVAKGLLAAAGAPGAATNLRIVPAGMTIIVKCVILHAPDGAMVPIVHARTSAGAPGGVWSPTLVQNKPDTWLPWLVLEPGDRLDIVQPANAGRLAYRISGTELDGVAP